MLPFPKDGINIYFLMKPYEFLKRFEVLEFIDDLKTKLDGARFIAYRSIQFFLDALEVSNMWFEEK